MEKVLRIGTRDSELALWQAKKVQSLLEHLGYATTLVPVKSQGDLTLDIPLWRATLRIGYQGEYLQAHVNKIKYHTYTHTLLLGVTKTFKLTHVRR